MKPLLSSRSALITALLIPLLVACGGSGNDDTPAAAASGSSSGGAALCVAPSSSSSSSSSSGGTITPLTCPSGAWFCDDFQDGTTAKWDLPLAASGTVGPADGSFAVVAENGSTNKVLQYTAAAKGGILALSKSTALSGVTSADYSVEARFKPMTNSTTSNKRLALMGRYVDEKNWYGALLNVQNSTGSTQVELVKMINGTLSRTIQMKRAISQDGPWYTLRLEMVGTSVRAYFDGERVVSATYTDGIPTGSAAFTELTGKGLIGVFTDNKSFQIDDVRISDPAVKPVQLTLSPALTTYTAEAGDAAQVVSVTAKKSDGVTVDTFTASSSNTSVVTATVSGTDVTLTPVGAGSATITITSGSDSKVTRTITANIAPQFLQASKTYTLGGKVVPAAGETAAYVDGNLQLTFDAAPTLTQLGSIRIFKKSDDSLVDVIKPTGETDLIGPKSGTNFRAVNTSPIRIAGNTVTITPHSNKLEYNTEYYVAIADGLLTGANFSGTSFAGLGKAANWSFKTKAAAPTALDVTVDDTGTTADFRTVQGALNHIMAHTDKTTAATVTIKNGTYEELLFIRDRDKVTLKGESRDGVVIQYKNSESINSGSGASQASTASGTAGGRAVLLIEIADEFTLDTLTLKNTTLRSPASSQAETLYFNGADTDRLIAKNANFYSEQDTIQVKGYSWFYNTLIAGNVDFIWGNNRVALFENSEIRSVGDTMCSSSGYILQSRTTGATDKGFVFLNSSLTSGVGPGGAPAPTAVYLARAAAGTWTDNAVYVNTKMGSHINPMGWAYDVEGQPKSNPATPTATSGWREYGSMDLSGAKLDVSKRVGGYILSDAEYAAEFSNRTKIFAAYNNGAGWNPAP